MPRTALKQTVVRKPNTRARKIVTVDAEVWAESGGTAGIYGAAWRAGRLKIVSEHLEPLPTVTAAQRAAARREIANLPDLAPGDTEIEID